MDVKIRKIVLAWLIVIGLPISNSALAKPVSSGILESTALILVFDDTGEVLARASGVIIGPEGTVLTNRHVVEDEVGQLMKNLVIFPTNKNEEPDFQCGWRATAVVLHPTNDLAVLYNDQKLPCSITFANNWANQVPMTGTDVQVLGYPAIAVGSLSVTLTRGQVSGKVNTQNGSLAYLKTDAKIISGTSGGPVIDENGTLVGLATAFTYVTDILGKVDSSQEFIGLIIPSVNIATFLGAKGKAISYPNIQPQHQKQVILEEKNDIDPAKNFVSLEKVRDREMLRNLGRDGYCSILIETTIPGIEELIDIAEKSSFQNIRARAQIYRGYLSDLKNDRSKNCIDISWNNLLPPDIEKGSWYEFEASALVLKGDIKQNAPFRPNELATRSDVVRLIVNSKVYPVPEVDRCSFSDVSDMDARYFEYAAQQGWLKGDSNCYGTQSCAARPDSSITRAEMAALFMRSFNKMPSKISSTFLDNPKDQWFTEFINDAVSVCILRGDAGKNTVRPISNVTRGEMLVMFYRVVGKHTKPYPNCGYLYKREPTYTYPRGFIAF